MNEQPTDQQPALAEIPRAIYGYLLGAIAALATAFVYAFAAEILNFTFGLLFVALFGGWAIGTLVGHGAWAGRPHVEVRSVQIGAAIIGALAWLLALILAYVVSQAVLPSAATPFMDRVSLSGFVDYFAGMFDFVQVIHLVALANVAFLAWRSAR